MIRPYERKDVVACLALFVANCPKFFSDEELVDYKNYLLNELEDYFVLEEQGNVVAAGGINYEANKAIISWDMVHPDQHGKGLGKQLTSYRLNMIKHMKGPDLIVVRTSQHTFKFYEKMGFLLEEIVKDYWAPGFDLYSMEMKLDA